MKRWDVSLVTTEHLLLTWPRACVCVRSCWWRGVGRCRRWRLLLSLYSALHHLIAFTPWLALLRFSSTDLCCLTWFQRAGSAWMDCVSEKSFSCVFALLRRHPLITTNILSAAAGAVIRQKSWKCWEEELWFSFLLKIWAGRSRWEGRRFERAGWMAPAALKGGPKGKKKKGRLTNKKNPKQTNKKQTPAPWWEMLASVLLLLKQESVCSLTTAWHIFWSQGAESCSQPWL